MGIVDSLLSFFRDNRAASKERRFEVASYLRRIARCCAEFREALQAIQRLRKSTEFCHLDQLQRPMDRLAVYFEHLDEVLRGRVTSELLDDVAVTMARVVWAEIPLVSESARGHPAILNRMRRVWRIFDPYDVVLDERNQKGRWVPVQTRLFHTFGLFHALASNELAEEQQQQQKRHGVKNHSQFEVFELDFTRYLKVDAPPSVNEYLSHLSVLETNLDALADAVESGYTR